MDRRSRLLMRLRYFGFVACAFVLSIASVRMNFSKQDAGELSSFALLSIIGCLMCASCLSGLVYCVLFWLMGNMRNADPISIAQALASVIPMGLIAPSLTFILFRALGIEPPRLPIPPDLFPWLVGVVNMLVFFKGMPPTRERMTQWKYCAMVAAAFLGSAYLGLSLTAGDLFLLIPGLTVAWLLGILGIPPGGLKTYLMVSVHGTFLWGLLTVAAGVFETRTMTILGLSLVVFISLAGLITGNHLCEVDATIARPARRRHAKAGRHRADSQAMPSPSPSISGRYPGWPR